MNVKLKKTLKKIRCIIVSGEWEWLIIKNAQSCRNLKAHSLVVVSETQSRKLPILLCSAQSRENCSTVDSDLARPGNMQETRRKFFNTPLR